MHPTRSFTFSCLALVVLAALSGQALSSTVAVGTCMPALPSYGTIQFAVTHVPAGSTIEICPGTYPEQVSIIAKNLTLKGIANAGGDAVVILPPAGGLQQNTTDLDSGNPIAAQLLVQNAGPVSISNLTVDGTGNKINDNSTDLMGILFQNATGTVNHVAVRNQLPDDILQGDSGFGQSIYVQTAAGHSSTVTVENSSVHNYNKNGITGNDPGTNLTVTGSYVQGAGALPYGFDAQNGIQLGFGATGKISGNTVIDNSWVWNGTGIDWVATDILLYDTAENSGIKITSNIVGNSQIPIALVTDTANIGDGVYVAGNKIFGTSAWDAIDLCTSGNIVTGNTIFNSAESGVHLDASCGAGTNNTVTGNTIVESACAGILVDSGASGTTTPDTYYTVPFPVASPTNLSSCTIPPAALTRAKAPLKFSPKK